MPWRTSTVETERARFVLEAELSDLSFSELCRRHGISRPTSHKWLERYREKGLEGLKDRSRRPRSCPHATALDVVERILVIRKRLSVWWIKLGILPDLIEPASPHQNGRHERMHRDLKAETTLPPAGNHSAQQRRFNTFRSYFNEIRPHEALGQKPPASVYQPSTQPFPRKLAPPQYPTHFEVRKVSTNGGIRWHSEWINVSHLRGGEYIGLEEVAEDVWSVYFGPVSLGCMHVRKGVIICHDGSSSRNPRL